MAKNKFDLLLKLESDKEESLRMSYLQANQNLQANQQKLQGLNDFRLEYSQQLHLKGQSGLSSGVLFFDVSARFISFAFSLGFVTSVLIS